MSVMKTLSALHSRYFVNHLKNDHFGKPHAMGRQFLFNTTLVTNTPVDRSVQPYKKYEEKKIALGEDSLIVMGLILKLQN